MKLKLFECPTCRAKPDEPCRTPKGRKKQNVHDTRPFALEREGARTIPIEIKD